MSEFECLFRRDITPTGRATETVKFVTVNRKGSDGVPFLQVRLFKSIRPYYKPTTEGVSLSLRQTHMLMELAEQHLTVNESNSGEKYVSHEGLHNLTGDAWIGVAKGGKQILLMRKNGEGIRGVTVTVEEYSRLRGSLGAVNHIMFPSPPPKDVEIIEPLAYELQRIINVIRYEECEGCDMELENMELGHDCVMLSEEATIHRYFKKAVKGVNLPRVLTHVEYLHGLLKCRNPLPTAEEVKKYLLDCNWFVRHNQKESSYLPLLTSFEDLHD